MHIWDAIRMRPETHWTVEFYVLLWTKEKKGAGRCLGFGRGNRQFIGSRGRAEHLANKFLLGNPEIMGHQGALANRPLLRSFLFNTKMRMLRFLSGAGFSI